MSASTIICIIDIKLKTKLSELEAKSNRKNNRKKRAKSKKTGANHFFSEVGHSVLKCSEIGNFRLAIQSESRKTIYFSGGKRATWIFFSNIPMGCGQRGLGLVAGDDFLALLDGVVDFWSIIHRSIDLRSIFTHCATLMESLIVFRWEIIWRFIIGTWRIREIVHIPAAIRSGDGFLEIEKSARFRRIRWGKVVEICGSAKAIIQSAFRIRFLDGRNLISDFEICEIGKCSMLEIRDQHSIVQHVGILFSRIGWSFAVHFKIRRNASPEIHSPSCESAGNPIFVSKIPRSHPRIHGPIFPIHIRNNPTVVLTWAELGLTPSFASCPHGPGFISHRPISRLFAQSTPAWRVKVCVTIVC